MKIEKKDLIYALIIFVIFLFSMYNMNKANQLNTDATKYEQTISALNDSIRKVNKKGYIEFSKHTPEIDINKLVNSAYFKTLTKEQQNFYNELKNIKGLISSTNIQLTSQGNSISKLLNNNSGKVHADSITYKIGSELLFKEMDSTKKMQWDCKLVIKENPVLDFKYKYNVDITTNYVRQKDKSILVTYKIDDTSAQINKMYNYTIPVEQQTKFKTWVDKNRFSINLIGGSILFGTGIYIGTKF